MDTPIETGNALRNVMRRLSLRNYFPILLLVVLIAFFSLNSPRFSQCRTYLRPPAERHALGGSAGHDLRDHRRLD